VQEHVDALTKESKNFRKRAVFFIIMKLLASVGRDPKRFDVLRKEAELTAHTLELTAICAGQEVGTRLLPQFQIISQKLDVIINRPLRKAAQQAKQPASNSAHATGWRYYTNAGTRYCLIIIKLTFIAAIPGLALLGYLQIRDDLAAQQEAVDKHQDILERSIAALSAQNRVHAQQSVPDALHLQKIENGKYLVVLPDGSTKPISFTITSVPITESPPK
ncbi:MAG: hypothetical protein WCL39_09670, partial [Armatimonadota bacterium]